MDEKGRCDLTVTLLSGFLITLLQFSFPELPPIFSFSLACATFSSLGPSPWLVEPLRISPILSHVTGICVIEREFVECQWPAVALTPPECETGSWQNHIVQTCRLYFTILLLNILLDWLIINQKKVWSWYMPRCFVHPFSTKLWSSCMSLELRAEITVKPLPFPLCPILLQVLSTLFAKPFSHYYLFASECYIALVIRVF